MQTSGGAAAPTSMDRVGRGNYADNHRGPTRAVGQSARTSAASEAAITSSAACGLVEHGETCLPRQARLSAAATTCSLRDECRRRPTWRRGSRMPSRSGRRCVGGVLRPGSVAAEACSAPVFGRRGLADLPLGVRSGLRRGGRPRSRWSRGPTVRATLRACPRSPRAVRGRARVRLRARRRASRGSGVAAGGGALGG